MKVKITRVDKSLPLPIYHTKGAVGCDLPARVTTKILPHCVAKIPANIIVATPPGFMFVVASRSSTPFKKGLLPAGGIGIGDPDFCGPKDEYQITVYNFTDQEVIVERGERVAQGIFVPVEIVQWEEIDEITDQNRGSFGSTGHK